jgi:hypothetical protein
MNLLSVFNESFFVAPNFSVSIALFLTAESFMLARISGGKREKLPDLWTAIGKYVGGCPRFFCCRLFWIHPPPPFVKLEMAGYIERRKTR